MEARAWGLLLLFVLLRGEETAAAADNNAFCPVDDRLLSHFFLLSGDSCLASSAPPQGGVLEGDESTLHKASNLVYKNSGDYVAVLFYASWCPFSKTCRPNFDAVSRLFPAIRHFAFEESLIRPSVLSKYRVYGFPTLFLVNATRRVYYHGSREVNSFITFYRNVTGIEPVASNKVPPGKSMTYFIELEQNEDMNGENCPFSWARSPEKLLQQDTYLAVATTFVLLKLLYILVPKLLACINHAWKRHIRYASLISLIQVCAEQVKHTFGRLNPYYKRQNLHEGALNASRAWASKSLASVSIAEPNSRGTHCA